MTDQDDMTAAELALGLLEGDERAAALRRVLAEPGFAAEVDRWRAHFAGLFAAVPDVEPAPAVLGRIETALDGRPAPARRSALWPSVAGLTSLAAAAMLALLVTRPAPTPTQVAVPAAPTALLAAAITPTDKGEPLSAIYDPATGTLRLSQAALTDARHSAELWVIGSDGVPHSLGLLRNAGTTALVVAPAYRPHFARAAVLAVSVEPIGGSPTGQPTGPVVAKGALSRT
jgi:anti-sigma-K factor RskA